MIREQGDRFQWTSPLLNAAFVGCIHAGALGLAIVIAKLFGIGSISEASFVQFDAHHYRSIADGGYDGFLAAFFPLFPLIWRVLDASVFGVCVVNGIAYLISITVLSYRLRTDWRTLAVWASVPSSIFYFLPYSESVFFVCAVILLVGLRNKQLLWACIGLFLCTLTRPSFSVLLPALVVAEILVEGIARGVILRIGAYMLTCFLGLGLVAFIQHLDTGCWTCFMSVQKGWGNELQLPVFPLTSWGGGAIVRLDSVALLVGLSSAAYLVYLITRNRQVRMAISKDQIVSLCYLAGISALVLFMRGGELFSLNRFVFATPFAFVALYNFKATEVFRRWKGIVGFWLGLMTYFMLFGAYVHIQVLFSYALIAALLVLFVNCRQAEASKSQWRIFLYAIVALCLQAFLMVRYLTGQWVA